MSLQRMAFGLQGKLLRAAAQQSFGEVCTDSRALKAGQVFLALRGEHFDGHRFLAEALNKGARALVAESFSPKVQSLAVQKRAGLVQVKDSLSALQALAADQRRLFSGPVVGITGSNGKTGTKNCLIQLLNSRAAVLATQGNFNNHIGLPLTLLQAKPEQRFAVLEMGMNHAGELSQLGKIARPDVAVVTNVGDAHLEFFKNRQGIAAAKAELVQSLRSDGWAILNGDDPLVAKMAGLHKGRSLFFGFSKRCHLQVLSHKDSGAHGLQARLLWKGREGGPPQREVLNLKQGGTPILWNSLAAITAALGLGFPFSDLCANLAGYLPQGQHRLQVSRLNQFQVILDCYNASPQSMQAALDFLKQSAPAAQRVAVLGDMLELGTASSQLHRVVGQQAKRAGVRVLAALGQQAKEVCCGFGADLSRAFEAGRQAEAAAWLRQQLKPGDWVLFKGSHGMHIEKVYENLKAESPSAL